MPLVDPLLFGQTGRRKNYANKCEQMNKWVKTVINLVDWWWRYGHVVVHSCRVHRETVETVEETCDWALTVTSGSLWTTSARRWCRLFPLHWWRGPSTVDRQVLRPWRPTSLTGTRSAVVWRSCETSRRQSLQQFDQKSATSMFKARLHQSLHSWDWRKFAHQRTSFSNVIYNYEFKQYYVNLFITVSSLLCITHKLIHFIAIM